MTVKELIEQLECYDEDMSVLFQPENSMYVEGVSFYMGIKEVNRFYGEPKEFLIIGSDGQVGAV